MRPDARQTSRCIYGDGGDGGYYYCYDKLITHLLLLADKRSIILLTNPLSSYTRNAENPFFSFSLSLGLGFGTGPLISMAMAMQRNSTRRRICRLFLQDTYYLNFLTYLQQRTYTYHNHIQ